MAESVVAVIPARLGSTRFKRKVLYQFRGKPLLYYVWRDIARARLIDRLVIATDAPEIEKSACAFGAEVVRTSPRHRTGSDRMAEVAAGMKGSIFINIQADNLGLQAVLLDRVIRYMQRRSSVRVASLAARISSDSELFDPNCVKVVISKEGEAMWFSRYPIPYLQHATRRSRYTQVSYNRHIGVYFFRRDALRSFARSSRTAAERAESLEQLRILENGVRIRMFMTDMKSVSVDSPQDVAKLDSIYR
ncbi:MAG: 3-deoxy-manno-octulosonate cytidylyltransferase [Candidatus Zixiibacteriota bacterium]